MIKITEQDLKLLSTDILKNFVNCQQAIIDLAQDTTKTVEHIMAENELNMRGM